MYSITSLGQSAYGGGITLFGKEKLDKTDYQILEMLSGGSMSFDDLEVIFINDNLRSHLDRLIKLEFVDRGEV